MGRLSMRSILLISAHPRRLSGAVAGLESAGFLIDTDSRVTAGGAGDAGAVLIDARCTADINDQIDAWRCFHPIAPIVLIDPTHAQRSLGDAWLTDPGSEILIEVLERLLRDSSPPLSLGSRQIDLTSQVLRDADGAQHPLSDPEVQLLRILWGSAGRPVPAVELCRQIWGDASALSQRSLVFTKRRLRQKIELDPTSPCYLRDEGDDALRLVSGPLSPEPQPRPSSAQPGCRSRVYRSIVGDRRQVRLSGMPSGMCISSRSVQRPPPRLQTWHAACFFPWCTWDGASHHP